MNNKKMMLDSENSGNIPLLIKNEVLKENIDEKNQILQFINHNAQLNKYKILDPEIIKQLSKSVGGDIRFVSSILEGFEEEATQQIANVIEGYKTNNCKQVQGELHTLKGNAGTLGAMRLYEITRIIEEKAKHCDFQLFESEIVVLQEEFNEFKKALSTLKNE